MEASEIILRLFVLALVRPIVPRAVTLVAHFSSKGLLSCMLALGGELGSPVNAVAMLAHTPRMVLSVLVRTMGNILLFSTFICGFGHGLHHLVPLLFLTSEVAVDADTVLFEVKCRLELLQGVIIYW